MTHFIKLNPKLHVCPGYWQKFIFSAMDEYDNGSYTVELETFVDDILRQKYTCTVSEDESKAEFLTNEGYTQFMLEWL